MLLAVALDLLWGDPPNRFHPVVLMGHWLSWGQKIAPQRYRFGFGMGWIINGIALFALPFWPLKKINNWKIGLLLAPLLLKPVFAYRNLRQAVAGVGDALNQNNLPEARKQVGYHLVSRETNHLTETEVAGATIESLAENLTDSLTAPLLAYVIGGLPAAWAYRLVNTADAMWGYRTPELEWLGKFPARLDDALNWLPARLTGWLLVIAARLSGEDATGAAQTMLAQHSHTPSLNAGWTMSAMAGALGITLSKQDTYQLTGGQAQPKAVTITRALRISDICVGLIVLVLVILSWPQGKTTLSHGDIKQVVL